MKSEDKEAQREAINAILKFAKSGMVKRKPKPKTEEQCEEEDNEEEEMEA